MRYQFLCISEFQFSNIQSVYIYKTSMVYGLIKTTHIVYGASAIHDLFLKNCYFHLIK